MKKKVYETPQVKAYQVKTASLIATSGNTEEYDLRSTDGWF